MNFGNRFPQEADGEEILVYLLELRETLTAWDKSIQSQINTLKKDIGTILAAMGGG